MSKIIDKLKGIDKEELNQENLEYIEIVDENISKKNKNFLRIIVGFLIFLIAIYGGFKLAGVFFSVPQKNILSEKKQPDVLNNINVSKEIESRKTDTSNKKEIKPVVFSGGKDFEKFLLTKLSLEPQNPIVINNLAIFYFENSNIDNALKYAQKALMLEPENPYFWNNLGIVLTELKLYEDAEKCFKKAIEKRSEEGVFYYNLANLYERQDKLILSRENYLLYLSKSDKINPKMLEYVREKLKKGV